MLFARNKTYDRIEALARADQFRARGRRRRAIKEYRYILQHEPGDHVVAGKLAPLLAAAGKKTEAWSSFRLAAQGYEAKGFTDKSMAMWVQASSFFPTQTEVWDTLATRHVQSGRNADAVKVLLNGRKHFKGRAGRQAAIFLLERVLVLDPGRVDATVDLAWQLTRTGRRNQALDLLQSAGVTNPRAVPRLRWTAFALAPGLATLWGWLLALVRARRRPGLA